MRQQRNKVYPGLLDDDIEMFNDGTQLRVLRGGKVNVFPDMPVFYIELIKEYIAKNKQVEKHLKAMHPDSEMKRVEQFCICNFSGLDLTPDIKNGVLQQGEYWPCPKRGICPAEGIVCKAIEVNGNSLKGREIQVIKLLATAMTNEKIADSLSMSLGTFEFVRTGIYKKLGVQTKQEVALLASSLNII